MSPIFLHRVLQEWSYPFKVPSPPPGARIKWKFVYNFPVASTFPAQSSALQLKVQTTLCPVSKSASAVAAVCGGG